MPTLALSSTATGDLKQVQTWSKVASDKKVMLSSAAIVVSNTLPGSAWATSKVVVKFLRSQTAGIKKAQSALLEIQVTFNASDEDAADDWTWFIPVDLVLALIA